MRAYDEAQKRNIKLLVGTRLVTVDGFEVLTYPSDRAAYGRLCRLITAGNLKAKKGECELTFEQILSASEGQIFIALPPLCDSAHPARTSGITTFIRPSSQPWPAPRPAAPFSPAPIIIAATSRAGSACWPNSAAASARRSSPSTTLSITHRSAGRSPTCSPACAKNARLAEAGLRLTVNAERHLKPPAEMARLFQSFPDAIARTVEIAEACRFSLGELKYEYPDEPVPEGKTAQQHLEDLTWTGARERYPLDRLSGRHSRRRAKTAAR